MALKRPRAREMRVLGGGCFLNSNDVDISSHVPSILIILPVPSGPPQVSALEVASLRSLVTKSLRASSRSDAMDSGAGGSDSRKSGGSAAAVAVVTAAGAGAYGRRSGGGGGDAGSKGGGGKVGGKSGGGGLPVIFKSQGPLAADEPLPTHGRAMRRDIGSAVGAVKGGRSGGGALPPQFA